MCASEFATRGMHAGGPRPTVTFDTSCWARTGGGGAIQGPTLTSTEQRGTNGCTVEPGTSRSMQGQGIPAIGSASASAGVLLVPCPSQPSQIASDALISMLTHPSSSMQTTSPRAGEIPVKSTSARQSQSVRRWRKDNFTREGMLTISAPGGQVLKVILTRFALRGGTWGHHVAVAVPSRRVSKLSMCLALLCAGALELLHGTERQSRHSQS